MCTPNDAVALDAPTRAYTGWIYDSWFDCAQDHTGKILVPADIQYRLAHHGLTLAAEEANEVCRTVMTDPYSEYRDRSLLEAPTEAELTRAIDFALTHLGLLDAPGDCPECGRNGPIWSPKHADCAAKIMAKPCAWCGQANVTNTRAWAPICEACHDHQSHLDAI